MPNAFTPGSGVNNEFKLMMRGIAGLRHFRIFNRWGVLLFETKDINIGWDGSYKGEPQPFGVYIYDVEAVSSVNGKVFPDGKHLVGDDSAVKAEGDVITVFYQDATAGTLRRASGTKSGATHKWELRTLQQPNKFGGYYPQIVPGENKVANFWEQTDRATKSRVGDVTILTP
jgi:gliding motility-associated-like protein